MYDSVRLVIHWKRYVLISDLLDALVSVGEAFVRVCVLEIDKLHLIMKHFTLRVVIDLAENFELIFLVFLLVRWNEFIGHIV